METKLQLLKCDDCGIVFDPKETHFSDGLEALCELCGEKHLYILEDDLYALREPGMEKVIYEK